MKYVHKAYLSHASCTLGLRELELHEDELGLLLSQQLPPLGDLLRIQLDLFSELFINNRKIRAKVDDLIR